MMNTHAWHGKAPNNEQLESAYTWANDLRRLLIALRDAINKNGLRALKSC